MNEKELEKIENEANEWHNKLEDISKTDEVIKNLYRGISIWFSPISENPDIMFLGINPGAGYYNNNNKNLIHRIKPLTINEYADKNQTYKLKNEWEYIFGNKENCLNRPDLLEKSVKSNFHP